MTNSSEMLTRSGQIIATENTSFHTKWWFSTGNPLISGKSRLVKYYNLARLGECLKDVLFSPYLVRWLILTNIFQTG